MTPKKEQERPVRELFRNIKRVLVLSWRIDPKLFSFTIALDEPTSSIDAEAEEQIFENLYKVYKDKSLILISHRFSTVRNADKIIVLKDGKMAEEGNHESLMKKNGIYARMFRKQAKGYIE